MMQAFNGVYLIQLDAKSWGWGRTGFDVQTVPTFFRLDNYGRPTGDKITGGVASALDPWFHRP
jgi:hypothetical protein